MCPIINPIINTVMTKNLLKTINVKASDLHYDYVTNMAQYMSDMAIDGEPTSWADFANEMDLLKDAVTGKASVESLQKFFNDGNTMMGLGSQMSEFDNFFHKEGGKEDEIALVITDEQGQTLYIIPGKYIKY